MMVAEREGGDPLHQGHMQRSGDVLLDVEAAQTIVGFVEATHFVVLAAEHFDHLVPDSASSKTWSHRPWHAASYGCLAQALAEHAHRQRHQGRDHQRNQA